MAQTQQQETKSALDRPVANVGELRSLFGRKDVRDQIALTLPKHMSPDRLSKIAMSAVLQEPKLMKCNQLTLVQALTKLSELGLEPGSAFGHVYLLPFENRKANRWDITIIIGYRGYIELARRSGYIEQIETHVVFPEDEFELVYGLDDTRKLRHVPNFRGPRDPQSALVSYCIVRMKGGASHVEVMSMNEVRTIRDRSQSWKFKPNTGPWQDDFLEMARKTVIRRTQKYLPLSAEQRDAMELEDNDENVVEGTITKPSLAPVEITQADDVANAMANARASEPEDAETEPHDPVTGEVKDAGDVTSTDSGPAQVVEQPEPEAGTVDHLLWRVAKSSGEELSALTQEAGKLSKDEPRRLEVSKAIAERRKAVNL